MTEPILSFVHFSDTHIGQDRDYARYGYASLPCLERFIATLNEFRIQPDFVLHTGDVSSNETVESYEIAAEVLSKIQAPLYFVRGNHDDAALMRRYLKVPEHPSGDPDAPVDYTFEVKGERFLVLDAQNDVVPDPQGFLRQEQLDRVRQEATPAGPPLTVLLHYPLFKMASPWLDKHMLVTNGASLHEALLPARDRLRAVLYGHMHRSSQVIRDGIAYVCAPSTFSQFEWRPWDDTPEVDHDSAPGYNYVQYFSNQIAVYQYTFPGCS